MLQPKNQESLQLVLGSSSVATQTKRTPAQLEKIPYAAVYDSLTQYSLPQVVKGFEAKTPAIRKIVITQVISAIQGQQSVKEAMDQAQEQATAAVGG
jgi:multiple sugar transport system substrate-binding protein